jgi:hypothetical protein
MQALNFLVVPSGPASALAAWVEGIACAYFALSRIAR